MTKDGAVTKEQLEADLSSWTGGAVQISVVMPISQLAPFATVTLQTVAECSCGKCQERPEGQRHIVPVLVMLSSVEGLASVSAQFPDALVVYPGQAPSRSVAWPKAVLAPALKCAPHDAASELVH